MKRFGFAFFASCFACLGVVRAADATTPIDYTERNTPFAPGATAQPDARKPQRNETTQHKRVTPPTVTKQPAALGDQRAAIDVDETRAKVIREKDARTPEKLEQPKSRFDQQRARFSTSDTTSKPPTVAKYQDSLTAASASNMARFPALSSATSAKVNRFVFRKNGGELMESPSRGSVTPAAGGSALSK